MPSKTSACCSASRSSGSERRELSGPASEQTNGSTRNAVDPPTADPVRDPHSAYDVQGSRSDMIYLAGGEFLMGTGTDVGFPSDGEGPVRKITVRPFYIDPCTVTNEQFRDFVESTGYVTEAETYGWSFVFSAFVSEEIAKTVTRVVQNAQWWWRVDGASWRMPEGPGSTMEDRLDHPVVHVSWNDAAAYCRWTGKRLPTEAEWEFAARGGLVQKAFPWGDRLQPGGKHMCNIWQGTFPTYNTGADGYRGTAPAKSYPPNGYGLYNVAGNVWEWCSDWFSATFHIDGPRVDPKGPPEGIARVTRGGSYLCHKTYCNRYRVAARSSNTPDSSTGNIGFRCVADA